MKAPVPPPYRLGVLHERVLPDGGGVDDAA